MCGAETELWINGVPICIQCAEDRERVKRESSSDPQTRRPESPKDQG